MMPDMTPEMEPRWWQFWHYWTRKVYCPSCKQRMSDWFRSGKNGLRICIHCDVYETGEPVT